MTESLYYLIGKLQYDFGNVKGLGEGPSLRIYNIIPSFQKILTMIPTEEEKQKIQEAQLANPDVPLGSAEQFLLTLSSISELSARLHLWAFKMDYETTEKVRI